MIETVKTAGFQRPHSPSATVALLALLITMPAYANESDFERAQLSLMLRQLDAVERHSRQSADQQLLRTSRYHFDYSRFQSDLERIRTGIQDYLTPQRAQPRDPFELSGDYLSESEPRP